MAKIRTLIKCLTILEKYIDNESEYDVSSYEDENFIAVGSLSREVSEEDKAKLEELEAGYDEETELWFVGN
jgi:hypothetical protein